MLKGWCERELLAKQKIYRWGQGEMKASYYLSKLLISMISLRSVMNVCKCLHAVVCNWQHLIVIRDEIEFPS